MFSLTEPQKIWGVNSKRVKRKLFVIVIFEYGYGKTRAHVPKDLISMVNA